MNDLNIFCMCRSCDWEWIISSLGIGKFKTNKFAYYSKLKKDHFVLKFESLWEIGYFLKEAEADGFLLQINIFKTSKVFWSLEKILVLPLLNSS